MSFSAMPLNRTDMTWDNLEEKTEMIRLEAGLHVLRQADPTISTVMKRATFVSVYVLNEEDQQWSRAEIEGALYIVSRATEPKYRLIILNQRNPQNLVEDITSLWEVSAEENYIFFRVPIDPLKQPTPADPKDRRVAGLWFSDDSERQAVQMTIDTILLQLSTDLNQESSSVIKHIIPKNQSSSSFASSHKIVDDQDINDHISSNHIESSNEDNEPSIDAVSTPSMGTSDIPIHLTNSLNDTTTNPSPTVPHPTRLSAGDTILSLLGVFRGSTRSCDQTVHVPSISGPPCFSSSSSSKDTDSLLCLPLSTAESHCDTHCDTTTILSVEPRLINTTVVQAVEYHEKSSVSKENLHHILHKENDSSSEKKDLSQSPIISNSIWKDTLYTNEHNSHHVGVEQQIHHVLNHIEQQLHFDKNLKKQAATTHLNNYQTNMNPDAPIEKDQVIEKDHLLFDSTSSELYGDDHPNMSSDTLHDNTRHLNFIKKKKCLSQSKVNPLVEILQHHTNHNNNNLKSLDNVHVIQQHTHEQSIHPFPILPDVIRDSTSIHHLYSHSTSQSQQSQLSKHMMNSSCLESSSSKKITRHVPMTSIINDDTTQHYDSVQHIFKTGTTIPYDQTHSVASSSYKESIHRHPDIFLLKQFARMKSKNTQLLTPYSSPHKLDDHTHHVPNLNLSQNFIQPSLLIDSSLTHSQHGEQKDIKLPPFYPYHLSTSCQSCTPSQLRHDCICTHQRLRRLSSDVPTHSNKSLRHHCSKRTQRGRRLSTMCDRLHDTSVPFDSSFSSIPITDHDITTDIPLAVAHGLLNDQLPIKQLPQRHHPTCSVQHQHLINHSCHHSLDINLIKKAIVSAVQSSEFLHVIVDHITHAIEQQQSHSKD